MFRRFNEMKNKLVILLQDYMCFFILMYGVASFSHNSFYVKLSNQRKHTG